MLRAFPGGQHDFPGKPYRDLIYGTGLALANSMNIVQEAVAQGPYVPSGGAVYPGGGFGDRLEQIAMLLKRTDARVLGVNIGGWDTHTNQVRINGRQGDLLAQVAQGFQALHRDLQDQWDKLLIVTMTEFGRTSKENGRGAPTTATPAVPSNASGFCLAWICPVGGHPRQNGNPESSASWIPACAGMTVSSRKANRGIVSVRG